MRWLIPIPVVALMLLGVWVTGGLITDDFRLAMALTAVWMVLLGVVCLLISLRHRPLRVPILGAYAVTAAVLGVYLGLSSLADRVVDERVATASSKPATSGPRGQGAPSQPRNVLLGRGEIQSGEHVSHGSAAAIRLASGGRVLSLTDFETSPGPDLRVYLVAGPAGDESEVDDYVDLGGLKGNRGDQQYTLPADLDLRRHGTVVIWCRAFSVLFARAPLERA